MVADEHFVLRWPDNLPLGSGEPLLCAGIISYSPLKYFGLDKPGTKVGVVGLGGIGHVAVKMAKAFGAEVIVFSTAPAKKQQALEGLKVDHFVVSKDPEVMQSVASSLDGSAIGGLKETQGMLDFAATHSITADIELIPIDYVNTAMDRILKSDVKYRFVIDDLMLQNHSKLHGFGPW